MALGKNGIDLKAIAKDQKAIDSLPNKGRALGSKQKTPSEASKARKKIANKIHQQAVTAKFPPYKSTD